MAKIMEEVEKNYEKSSLNNMLITSKNASFVNPYGRTEKCGNGKCMCCKMVSGKEFVIGPNNKVVRTETGKYNS